MISTPLLALLIGLVAGLRTMTAPAAVSWAAWLGWLPLGDTWLAFFAHPWAAPVLTIFAIMELVGDKLPQTPSRKRPLAFAARIVSGAVSGAALTAAYGAWSTGLMAGIVGAVIGALTGYEIRSRLAARLGLDWPVALGEDAVAVGGAVLIVWAAGAI